jgi:hypothetical protein
MFRETKYTQTVPRKHFLKSGLNKPSAVKCSHVYHGKWLVAMLSADTLRGAAWHVC